MVTPTQAMARETCRHRGVDLGSRIVACRIQKPASKPIMNDSHLYGPFNQVKSDAKVLKMWPTGQPVPLRFSDAIWVTFG